MDAYIVSLKEDGLPFRVFIDKVAMEAWIEAQPLNPNRFAVTCITVTQASIAD